MAWPRASRSVRRAGCPTAGGAAFKSVGQRLIGLDSPRNQFGAVLDGRVITAPVVQGVTDAPEIVPEVFKAKSAVSTPVTTSLKDTAK